MRKPLCAGRCFSSCPHTAHQTSPYDRLQHRTFPRQARHDQAFLEAHAGIAAAWPGLTRTHIIKIGAQTYCIIAEWPDMETLAAARPKMLATLARFRGALDDLGHGLGLTDPVAGPAVLRLK